MADRLDNGLEGDKSFRRLQYIIFSHNPQLYARHGVTAHDETMTQTTRVDEERRPRSKS
jgi:hypothetical protein